MSRVRTFIASGSPNRALNSITIGPVAVFMNWPYRTPQNGEPSLAMARTTAAMIPSAASRSASVTNGRPWSGIEYDPMPPVFGPRSPSNARL